MYQSFMKSVALKLTAAEQMALHLSQLIRDRRLTGKLPGILSLATEYDVSPATMRSAIRILEEQGWLSHGGAGKPRVAQIPEKISSEPVRSLNVSILPGIPFLDEDAIFQRVVLQAQMSIDFAGHHCRMATKSQQDLHHDPERIARYVMDHPADAWILIGPHQSVAQWFIDQKIPAICIGGVIKDLEIASTGMVGIEEFERCLRHLLNLGHRRIVFLWPEYRVTQPEDSHIQILTKVLLEAGVPVGSYHVPKWKPTPEGLREVLEEQFRFTRPTAIITTYGKWMTGVLTFIAKKGLRVPHDLSLFSLSDDDWFAWTHPKISCLRGDDFQMAKRVSRWVDALAKGKADRSFVGYPITWEIGGTIGPAH